MGEYKMKVGIVTFHRAVNYGAVLQAYALQKAVEQLGNDCVILDYFCPEMEKYTKAFSMFNKKHIIKNYIIACVKAPFRKIRKRKFTAFCKKYLVLSEHIHNLQEEANRFDCFIAGSDQIWNDYLTGNDLTYFLKFVKDNHKKVSYAACFGMQSIPKSLQEQYKCQLAQFERISVRDETSKQLIEGLLGAGKEISIVADPTLLFGADFWSSFQSTNHEGRYVLVYSLNPEIGLMECAKKLRDKYGLKIIYICNDILEVKKYSYVKHLLSPTPEKFVSLIANANYVVTNSFHGTVFSIIFHKNFYCETNYGDKRNKRIEDLLEEVHCLDRIMNGEGMVQEKEIDWEVVDEAIEQIRQKSISYLKNVG